MSSDEFSRQDDPPPAEDRPDDPASTDGIEECLRVLDELWPSRDAQGIELPPLRLGKYTILHELGRGGFGVVFLAEDTVLCRMVALKVPRFEVVFRSEAWDRFLREARAAARLDHPNLVPLLDVASIGPVGYIVSGYIAGPSLEQWLQRHPGGSPPRWAARLVAILAHAMEYVHQRRILHCELKPANVLLQRSELDVDLATPQSWEHVADDTWIPRICDFGLAKLQELDADQGRTSIACGSPSYMAPEQAEVRRADIGPATDVYGLGAILYSMLTGRPPFLGESDLDTLNRVATDEPVPPRRVRPDVPRDLETICLKCLEKRPERRYAGAQALADDLERFLDGRPIAARPASTWERAGKWVRRNPAKAVLATAGLLMVLAVFGGILWHSAIVTGDKEEIRKANEELRKANEELRQAIEGLRQAIDRADASAREALAQRNLANDQAQLARRRLACYQALATQQAVTDGNFELAYRLLEQAGPKLEATGGGGFALAYLRRIVHDRLEVFAGHQKPISALVVAPDGGTLVSADEDSVVQRLEYGHRACSKTAVGRVEEDRAVGLQP